MKIKAVVDSVCRICTWTFKVSVLGAILIVFTRGITILPDIEGTEYREDILLTFTKVQLQFDERAPRMAKLKIINTMAVNAFTDRKDVYITMGMLESFKNTDTLAFFIGHELAHIADPDPRIPILSEKKADLVGLAKAEAAGYKACRGAEFFLVLLGKYDAQGGVSHPYNIDRVNYLRCGQ